MAKIRNQEQELYVLWISQRERIISFHAVENSDYERLVFLSQDAETAFVLQQWSNGFRIQ